MHTIATTILDQLGGNKFIAMTGAKHFVGIDRGLVFQLPRDFGFRVSLSKDDTYRVHYYQIKQLMTRTLATQSGIYADMLPSVFTYLTGLRTSL